MCLNLNINDHAANLLYIELSTRMHQMLGTLASTNHIEYLTKKIEDLIAFSKDKYKFDLDIDMQGPTLDDWDSGIERMTNYSLVKIYIYAI